MQCFLYVSFCSSFFPAQILIFSWFDLKSWYKEDIQWNGNSPVDRVVPTEMFETPHASSVQAAGRV